jgi:hypothetical protein
MKYNFFSSVGNAKRWRRRPVARHSRENTKGSHHSHVSIGAVAISLVGGLRLLIARRDSGVLGFVFAIWIAVFAKLATVSKPKQKSKRIVLEREEDERTDEPVATHARDAGGRRQNGDPHPI